MPALTTLLAGLGLFLYGLGGLTQALRGLAGPSLRQVLLRFTATPLSACLTGALATALLQSSTALSVATVGFVSAGLISFPSALAVILGANVGSTSLGWLVGLVGLKFRLGTVLLPAILAGAVVRLLSRGWVGQTAQAVASLGVIFLGLDNLQRALASQPLLLPLDDLPANQIGSRLALAGIGLLATLISHSSGLGVATALTALQTQQLQLNQAAALVIGMDVGTTITALTAAIGAGLAARRTALAHLVFNLASAVMALALIDPFITAWQGWLPPPLAGDPLVALTSFHTGFNLLGVALVLPVLERFAALIRWLLPGPKDAWSEKLEAVPPWPRGPALTMASQALEVSLGQLVQALAEALAPQGRITVDLSGVQEDLERVERYLDGLDLEDLSGPDGRQLLALLHVLDHLQRLQERCAEEPERAATLREEPDLADLCQQLRDLLSDLDISGDGDLAVPWRAARSLEQHVEHQLEPRRSLLLAAVATGRQAIDSNSARLEALRWLQRVSRHLCRSLEHLHRARLAAAERNGASA